MTRELVCPEAADPARLAAFVEQAGVRRATTAPRGSGRAPDGFSRQETQRCWKRYR